MTRIHVIPEELIRAAQQMADIGARISQAASELGSVLSGLDPRAYDVQLYGKVAGRVSSAQGAVQGPASKTANHAANLNERAQAFTAADVKQVVRSIRVVMLPRAPSVTWVRLRKWAVWERLPFQRIRVLFNMGGILGGPKDTQLPDANVVPPNANQQKPVSGFGRELERIKQEEATRQAEEAKKLQEAAQRQKQPRQVPLRSQANLVYKNKPTNYGCAPTAASMIMDYWHSKDPSKNTASPQDLIDENVAENEFGGTGMGIDKLKDDLKSLGYNSGIDDPLHVNVKWDDLKAAVEKGPVIANVMSRITTQPRSSTLGTTGDYHSVVVTDITDNSVTINDPWDGKTHTYTIDEFKKSWGAKSGGANVFLEIQP
jgi:hypothetical protein